MCHSLTLPKAEIKPSRTSLPLDNKTSPSTSRTKLKASNTGDAKLASIVTNDPIKIKKKKSVRYDLPEVPKFRKPKKKIDKPWQSLGGESLGKPIRVKLVQFNEDLNETHTVPKTATSTSTPHNNTPHSDDSNPQSTDELTDPISSTDPPKQSLSAPATPSFQENEDLQMQSKKRKPVTEEPSADRIYLITPTPFEESPKPHALKLSSLSRTKEEEQPFQTKPQEQEQPAEQEQEEAEQQQPQPQPQPEEEVIKTPIAKVEPDIPAKAPVNPTSQQQKAAEQRAERRRRRGSTSSSSSAKRKALKKFEAVRRWTPEPNVIYVNNIPYFKMKCIGSGGSSRVYRVLDKDLKIRALKWVSLEKADALTVESYVNEISLLRKLRGKDTIVQLIDFELKKNVCMFLLLECGETDLRKFFTRCQKGARKEAKKVGLTRPTGLESGIGLNLLRMYWEQMLRAVHTIHEARIVHGDLKPANFVLFKGHLKLIDFGIAKAIQNDTTNIVRENQIGTLNYISPEALIDTSEDSSTKQCMKLGRASDIWSLGCILYQMVYNHAPFSNYRNLMKKLHAITDESVTIHFGPLSYPELLDVLKMCLQRNPRNRPSIPQLLEHPFLQ